jgi:hypothetical protein
MYAGVVHYEFREGEMDAGLKRWNETVLPQTQKQKGFRGVLLFVNREESKAFDIGFWETEEDAVHYEDCGLFQLLIQDLGDVLREIPTREKFTIEKMDGMQLL